MPPKLRCEAAKVSSKLRLSCEAGAHGCCCRECAAPHRLLVGAMEWCSAAAAARKRAPCPNASPPSPVQNQVLAVIDKYFSDVEGAAARAAALRVQMEHGRDYHFHEGLQRE